jgi:hypothetical protein
LLNFEGTLNCILDIVTRDHFQTAERKARRIMFVVFPVFAGLGAYLLAHGIELLGGPFGQFGTTVRTQYGEVAGGAIGGLLAGAMVSIPLLLCVAVMYAIERRIGVRCPHCHCSVANGCLPRQVLESGECSSCHRRVFDESGDNRMPLNPTTGGDC